MSIHQIIKLIALLSSLIVGVIVSTSLHAEETPADTCTSAAKLFTQGDIEGALEEANWCVTQLKQLKQNQTSSFFLDEVNGYKAGNLDSQQTMGMSVIERSYSKDGQVIQVSLTGGGLGAAENIFSTITAFGMQSAPGEKVRIQRRTAVVSNDNGSPQVVVTMKSGGVLTFASSDVDKAELVSFAKAFPVADLDDSRK